MSYTYTYNQTFTLTNAKYLAAKVATDLKRIQRFYNKPSDRQIDDYETEVVKLLNDGYIDTITYGFKLDEKWIEPTLRYTARDLAGMNANDDDPGHIKPNANISGASFYSFLTYNSAWGELSEQQRNNYKNALPFKRSSGFEPGVNGYLSQDQTYSSGGHSLERSSVNSF